MLAPIIGANTIPLASKMFVYILRRLPQTILVIFACNIPLVGFHDILCVLILGHKLILKTSSKESVLIHFALE